MKCYNHPSNEAVGVCSDCGKAICKECVLHDDEKLKCSVCSEKMLNNLNIEQKMTLKTSKTIQASDSINLDCNLAGIWERLFATGFDLIIWVVGLFFIALILSTLDPILNVDFDSSTSNAGEFLYFIIFLIYTLFYFIWFESSKFAATPGKLLLRLRVVNASDLYGNEFRQISIGKVTIRFILKYVCLFISIVSTVGIILFLLSYILNTDKQLIYDRMLNTTVLKRKQSESSCCVCGMTNSKSDKEYRSKGVVPIGNAVGICPECRKWFCAAHSIIWKDGAWENNNCPQCKVELDFYWDNEPTKEKHWRLGPCSLNQKEKDSISKIESSYEIGILYDISELGSGFYGYSAYKLFFDAIDPHRVAISTIYDGDTSETLSGKENVYCITVQSMEKATIDYIRSTMLVRNDKGLLPVEKRLIEGNITQKHPLVMSGQIDGNGKFHSKNGMIGSSWSEGTIWEIIAE